MNMWTNSCRSCLKTVEPFSHFIYEHISPDQYFYCTSVQVKQDDELPKAICDNCYNLLINFIEFKTKCVASENKLLRFSRGSILHDKVSLEIDVKYEVEDTGQKYVNETATGIYSELKIKKEDDKEGEAGELTNDDTPDSIEANKVSNEPPGKPAAKIVKRPPRNLKCEQCSKSFTFQERLDGHMLTHEGKTETIECKECNKTFRAWGSLRRHIKSCHSRHPFKDVTCHVCSKVCKTPDTLRVHQKVHEERSERVCNECGKTFKSDVTFKHHLETHTNRTPSHPCEHCGKKYISKKTCAKHISRRHTNRKFICDYCGFSFTDKYLLQRHIMIHEGRSPRYKCDVCLKSFSSQATLILHRRMHSGERPFSCSHCTSSFSCRGWLVEHERTHNGETPFGCSVCEKRFSRKASVKRHMKVHQLEGCKRKSGGRAVVLS